MQRSKISIFQSVRLGVLGELDFRALHVAVPRYQELPHSVPSRKTRTTTRKSLGDREWLVLCWPEECVLRTVVCSFFR